MSDEIKAMPVSEFRELGFVQELNRRLLHPAGLALEVVVDDGKGPASDDPKLAAMIERGVPVLEKLIEAAIGVPVPHDREELVSAIRQIVGVEEQVCEPFEKLGRIWDYRDDPEGMAFGPAASEEQAQDRRDKFDRVEALLLSKRNNRVKALGFTVQPVVTMAHVKK